jgi:hypothetical protein
MNDAAIAEFWRFFQKHESELATASSADHPVYDQILDRLQQISPGLYFEFSSNTGVSELIITADGNRSLFDLVESIVAAAPKIPGWSVLALKPRLGFPVTARWETVTIAIADIVFEPLEQARSDDLGIRIFVPRITTESARDAHNALLRALDHALGERAFSESVQYIEVVPLSKDVLATDHIPLAQLENFINWRRKRRGERNDHHPAE